MNEVTVIIPEEQEDITVSAEEQANEVKLMVPNQTGDNGATFIPSVSADGVISWANDKGLPNPEPVNIKGAKGDKGDKGDRGLQGMQGIQGERGEQGLKGDKGDRGEQGIQGVQGLKGETGPQGPQGLKGDTGPTGPAYKLTEADKAEMVSAVISALPKYNGEVVAV